MKRAEDILLRPYITEKSNIDIAQGRYTFIVDTRATKTEIRQAVEKLFNVRVHSVNTVNYDGKWKRQGAHTGLTSSYKKAMVQIDLEGKPVTYLAKGKKEAATAKKLKTSIEEFGVSQ